MILSLLFYVVQVIANDLTDQVKVGDWVLRSGKGQESSLIKALSNSEFSHIGMIVAVEPQVLIVHATTNDDVEHPNQVIRSSFAEFSATKISNRIAIVRPTFMDAMGKQKVATKLINLLGQTFKLVPIEHSPRYCTTIIYDEIRTEYPNFELPWQTVSLPMLGGKYLFPQAFLDYPDIEWVFDSAGK